MVPSLALVNIAIQWRRDDGTDSAAAIKKKLEA